MSKNLIGKHTCVDGVVLHLYEPTMCELREQLLGGKPPLDVYDWCCLAAGITLEDFHNLAIRDGMELIRMVSVLQSAFVQQEKSTNAQKH